MGLRAGPPMRPRAPSGRWSAFAKEFPGEKVYRHTLAEETDALNQVATAAAHQVSEGLVDSLSPPLRYLIKLNEEGLVESYVLLRRADDEISEDYEKYR